MPTGCTPTLYWEWIDNIQFMKQDGNGMRDQLLSKMSSCRRSVPSPSKLTYTVKLEPKYVDYELPKLHRHLVTNALQILESFYHRSLFYREKILNLLAQLHGFFLNPQNPKRFEAEYTVISSLFDPVEFSCTAWVIR